MAAPPWILFQLRSGKSGLGSTSREESRIASAVDGKERHGGVKRWLCSLFPRLHCGMSRAKVLALKRCSWLVEYPFRQSLVGWLALVLVWARCHASGTKDCLRRRKGDSDMSGGGGYPSTTFTTLFMFGHRLRHATRFRCCSPSSQALIDGGPTTSGFTGWGLIDSESGRLFLCFVRDWR
ncbi:hypothetical protein B0H11DRAFT_2032967 [Mycena galericulata]|nr:hypothetical protein B0H11DRAFT_2032967 [Mycena galericulata]